jgi:UDP-glucose-4-epimerase GalE
MNKILVTGACGYIGSHVCKTLKDGGYQVVGLDRVKREHTLIHMNYFVQGDYHSEIALQALETHRPQAVIHLAGTSLVGPSMEDPAEYYTNNVAKTAAFLNALRLQEQPPVVVFSSSAAVYGAPEVDLIGEEQPFNPLSPYGQSKAMIEIMLADYHRAYGMSAMNLRYFNACGADESGTLGQEPGATHIIARLLESVRDKTTFTLYGKDYATPDGTCVRDYVHVSDLAEAHMLAMQYLFAFEGCFTLNLGSGRGHSNAEIMQTVGQLIGVPDIEHGERRVGDPDRLVANNFLAGVTLGWRPEHDLESIVNSAWKWYNNPSHTIDNSSK